MSKVRLQRRIKKSVWKHPESWSSLPTSAGGLVKLVLGGKIELLGVSSPPPSPLPFNLFVSSFGLGTVIELQAYIDASQLCPVSGRGNSCWVPHLVEVGNCKSLPLWSSALLLWNLSWQDLILCQSIREMPVGTCHSNFFFLSVGRANVLFEAFVHALVASQEDKQMFVN